MSETASSVTEKPGGGPMLLTWYGDRLVDASYRCVGEVLLRHNVWLGIWGDAVDRCGPDLTVVPGKNSRAAACLLVEAAVRARLASHCETKEVPTNP